MVDLSLDGALLWARWALRRLGFFAHGRPTALIEDLVGNPPATFYSGTLADRLRAANLSRLDAHHQRAIGIAVGQRVMRKTFVVRIDGLDPCRYSDDLETWPPAYRFGLVHGLWMDPDGIPTITEESLTYALDVIVAIEDIAPEMDDLVEQIVISRSPIPLMDQPSQSWAAVRSLKKIARDREMAPDNCFDKLAAHISSRPPF